MSALSTATDRPLPRLKVPAPGFAAFWDGHRYCVVVPDLAWTAGDALVLCETTPEAGCTGRELVCEVTEIQSGGAIAAGHVLLSLGRLRLAILPGMAPVRKGVDLG